VAIDLRIERTICPAKSSFSVILSPRRGESRSRIVRLGRGCLNQAAAELLARA